MADRRAWKILLISRNSTPTMTGAHFLHPHFFIIINALIIYLNFKVQIFLKLKLNLNWVLCGQQVGIIDKGNEGSGMNNGKRMKKLANHCFFRLGRFSSAIIFD